MRLHIVNTLPSLPPAPLRGRLRRYEPRPMLQSSACGRVPRLSQFNRIRELSNSGDIAPGSFTKAGFIASLGCRRTVRTSELLLWRSGAAIPRSGGQYNFSRRAIGEYAGLSLGGATGFNMRNRCAVGSDRRIQRRVCPLLRGHVKAIAVSVILGFGVLQWRANPWGSGAQILTAVLKTIAFLILRSRFALGGHARAVAAPVATPLR